MSPHNFEDSKFEVQWAKPSGWSCNITDGLVFRPSLTRKIPNWFHRLMQRLILGFRWEYTGERTDERDV